MSRTSARSGGAASAAPIAALEYAARGWRVFPLNGKVPFAGTSGFKHATTSRDVLRRWPKGANVGIGAEAAGLRIKRAERERQQYEAGHARDLIAELEPEARAITDRLEQAARDLVAADRAWEGMRSRIDTLLAATPNASPRMDAQVGHRLAAVARDARNALREGEVEDPLPTWIGLRAHEQAEHEARRLRERVYEPDAAS